MEASFILNRKQREVIHKDPGKEPGTRGCRHPLLIVDLHPLHTATGRCAFKNKTTQVFPLQFPHPLAHPAEHALRIVLLGARGDKPRGMRIAYQPQGLPGNAETALHLGTDRAILHVLPKRISKKLIEFVPTVPPNSLSEQARADPQFDTV